MRKQYKTMLQQAEIALAIVLGIGLYSMITGKNGPDLLAAAPFGGESITIGLLALLAAALLITAAMYGLGGMVNSMNARRKRYAREQRYKRYAYTVARVLVHLRAWRPHTGLAWAVEQRLATEIAADLVYAGNLDAEMAAEALNKALEEYLEKSENAENPVQD